MKKESLEEFLKRGGKIEKTPRTCDYGPASLNINRKNFNNKEDYLRALEKVKAKEKK